MYVLVLTRVRLSFAFNRACGIANSGQTMVRASLGQVRVSLCRVSMALDTKTSLAK